MATFKEQLAIMAEIFKGDGNGIIARKAKVTTQTVRNTFSSKAESYLQLSETQQAVFDAALELIEKSNDVESKLTKMLNG